VIEYLTEEGQSIEPVYYVPVIPMVLVNGAEGIGTGWSTSIPCFNPMDIVKNIRNCLEGKEFCRMFPWYKGFKGELDNNNVVHGKFKKVDHETLEITELPLRKWTRDYKNFLETLDFVTDIREFHTDNQIRFVLKVADLKSLDNIEKTFKLQGSISTSNYVLFDATGKIKKYQDEVEILREFFEVRLELYEKRRTYLLRRLRRDFEILRNKNLFIRGIIRDEVKIRGMKREEAEKLLKENRFSSIEEINKIMESDEGKQPDGVCFGYLLKMPIWNLTAEKAEELENQMADKEKELKALERKSPADLWLADLDQFE